MSTATATNGKPQRKQLSDQLDRLDGIIDALAEGLNGAVADAAREGTRLAVKDAIVEIMTNPESVGNQFFKELNCNVMSHVKPL